MNAYRMRTTFSLLQSLPCSSLLVSHQRILQAALSSLVSLELASSDGLKKHPYEKKKSTEDKIHCYIIRVCMGPWLKETGLKGPVGCYQKGLKLRGLVEVTCGGPSCLCFKTRPGAKPLASVSKRGQVRTIQMKMTLIFVKITCE